MPAARRSGSEVLAQPFQFIQQEVHIRPRQRRVGHDHAEEVAPGTMGLVANHHGALPHHALLEDWGHLWEEWSNLPAAAWGQVRGWAPQLAPPSTQTPSRDSNSRLGS